MKTLVRIGIFLIAICLSANYIFSAFEKAHYEKAIPKSLELSSTDLLGDSGVNPLIAFVSPLMARGSCGAVIFHLSDNTVEAIKKDGLKFFNTALHGRGYESEHDRYWAFYTYKPWEETPVPDALFDRGAWMIGLGCIQNSEPALIKQILDEAKQPGSYYTLGRTKELLVVPSLRLLLMTYSK